jgi:hypothetical protein
VQQNPCERGGFAIPQAPLPASREGAAGARTVKSRERDGGSPAAPVACVRGVVVLVPRPDPHGRRTSAPVLSSE